MRVGLITGVRFATCKPNCCLRREAGGIVACFFALAKDMKVSKPRECVAISKQIPVIQAQKLLN